MKFLKEQSREILVAGQWDVAVVGGGVASIAAALSAARAGASVILLEQQFVLGGLATQISSSL